MIADITPLVLTFNEAPNIRRSLAKLVWAHQIVVVDSFSTDDTVQILRTFPNVRILQREFDSFADQCNYGLEYVHTPWVLSLDADYVLSDALNIELAQLSADTNAVGYRVRFRYCVFGRPLRGSLYPPRTVLHRRLSATYRNEGHGHRLEIDGPIQSLHNVIYHDDRKALDRWLTAQSRYATVEARLLLDTPREQLNRADRIRRHVILAPLFVLLYTLFVKRVIFDGWPGWYYALQRTYAELLLSLKLLDIRLRKVEPTAINEM